MTWSAVADPTREGAVTRSIVDGMLSVTADQGLRKVIVEDMQRMPGRDAAALLYNHAHQDWRDLIPRITLPTLVVSGQASLVPGPAAEWIAGQIPGARLETFGETEGGGHFMFLENPAKFNALLADFIA